MSQPKTPSYGGQAVLEGVMFAGQKVNVTAVRRKNSELAFLEIPKEEIPWVQTLKKIPFVRGIVAILESSVKGTRHLNFSADIFAEEEEGGEAKSKPKEPGFFERFGLVLGVAAVGILSFVASKLIFTLVPMFVEQFLFYGLFSNYILHNLVEGVIKIVLLLGYLYAIGLTPPVKRLFMYHGAEHKVISAYEGGSDMSVADVQKYSRLHYRCGSSFIVFTVIIGVIIYSFFDYHSWQERMMQRIILIPVVIGVSYEVLKFTNSVRALPILRYLGYPGLWLQKLTTKEPDDSMVEVSLASFNRMMELDRELAAEQSVQPSYAS